MPKINYSPEIDAIIYAGDAPRLTRNQLLDLAKAAIDQALDFEEAGFQREIEDLIDDRILRAKNPR